jgi:hypothetical protein
VNERLLFLAENSNVHEPLGPSEELLVDERYVIWLGRTRDPGSTVVQRLRLTSENVEPMVADVRALLAVRGRDVSTWEIGNSATPPDLRARLEGLGMVPDDDPYAVGMVLSEPPEPGPPEITVRRAETPEERRTARSIMHTAFGGGPGDPEDPPPQAEHRATYLAYLEDEPVAAASASFVDGGVVLNAGSTLPHARGRGAYRALVAARWDDAVRRGTPALVTQAGRMSRPILQRLGFREVAEIWILRDEFWRD